MKLKASFLFFSLLVWFSHFSAKSQQEGIDSTSYYKELIGSPKNSEDLISAFSFFKNQLINYQKINHPLGEVYALISIAQAQKKIGFLNDSEKSAIEALEILDKTEPDDYYTLKYSNTLYNHLGKIYRELDNYAKAHQYYNTALDKIEKIEYRITILNNIGYVYHEQEKYRLAIDYYQKAYEASIKISDTIQEARALDNMGFSQSKINDADALKNLESGLRLRKLMNYDDGVFTSYMNLGHYYLDRNNQSKAAYYISKADQIVVQSNKIPQKIDLYELKFRWGDFTNYSEYRLISDSIANFERKSKNTYAALKYEKDKEIKRANENELKFKNSRLNEEIEKSKRITYQGLAVLILMLTVFVIIKMLDKHKKDKIKAAYRQEAELSKKVHDELANDMSDLMSFVENDIEVTTTQKSLLLDNIEDIYLRTRDISTETASIDLIDFPDSLSNLLLQHNKAGTKIVINDINTINWKKVPDYKKMVIYRCLQELMVNMKKHSRAKLVSVVFKEKKARKEIRYVDDGIGFSTKVTKFNGLANVESRIKGIGGSFNFTTSEGNGFKAILKFNS